jgi:hypothetical protein
MPHIARFISTCIAIAAALTTGTARAAETDEQSAPGAVANAISRLIAKAQALPLSLMPRSDAADQSSSSTQARAAAPAHDWRQSWVPPSEQQPPRGVIPTQEAPVPAPPVAREVLVEVPVNEVLASAQLVPRKAPTEEVQPSGQWELDATDSSLKRGLQRWCEVSGWQLVWELPVDFPIVARASFVGGFEQAVAAIALSMQNSQMPIKAVFYRGNNVLRIVAKGAQ